MNSGVFGREQRDSGHRINNIFDNLKIERLLIEIIIPGVLVRSFKISISVEPEYSKVRPESSRLKKLH